METIGRYNAAIYRVVHRLLAVKLKKLGIRGGQHDFILAISRNEGLNQKELSQLVYVNKSTTTKALKNLQDNGYLRTEQDPEDHRCNRIFLTAAGRSVTPVVESAFEEIIAILTKGLSESEIGHTLGILKKILGNATEEINKYNE